MKFNENFLLNYVREAPLALAFERVLECRIYAGLKFERPILDIGCGEGLFANILFAEQIDSGIDPDGDELARARDFGAYVELIQCEGGCIPKPDGSYRTIFSNSVLEHIPDVTPVLKEAHRLLVSGGRFYFTVPSTEFERYTWINLALETMRLKSQSRAFRKFFNRFWRHYHAYTAAGWSDLARGAGFELVEAFTYDPARTCLLNTALTPFALPSRIVRSIFNRWHLFPSLRRVLATPLAIFATPLLNGAERAPQGGLVFVSLRKP